jgi:site-specific DNA-cytosine methylase
MALNKQASKRSGLTISTKRQLRLRINFPTVKAIREDIRLLNESEYRLTPVDFLHAGFPCQSFSQAGNRLGFKDVRGLLFSKSSS